MRGLNAYVDRNVWKTWTVTSTTSSSSIYYTNQLEDQQTWSTWIDCSSSTENTVVWQSWIGGDNVQYRNVMHYTNDSLDSIRVVHELTPERREEIRVQQEQAETRRAEAAQKLKEAEERAEALLVENLSLRQRNEYLETKAFTVRRGDRRYRIRRGRTGNVDVIDAKGCVSHRLCIHPRDSVPDADTMLAQKLMLETDEDMVLRVANRHVTMTHQPVMEALQ